MGGAFHVRLHLPQVPEQYHSLLSCSVENQNNKRKMTSGERSVLEPAERINKFDTVVVSQVVQYTVQYTILSAS